MFLIEAGMEKMYGEDRNFVLSPWQAFPQAELAPQLGSEKRFEYYSC